MSSWREITGRVKSFSAFIPRNNLAAQIAVEFYDASDAIDVEWASLTGAYDTITIYHVLTAEVSKEATGSQDKNKGCQKMTDKPVPTIAGQSFEDLKKTNDFEAEYWSARDLQSLLGYGQWRRFEDAVKRAITSCEQSGNNPDYHFAGAGKMIELGKGGVREVDDYQLSRFACYLIAQNGDPRKPEIAAAQKYFAVQARRQELSDQHAADRERLELRKQTSEEFKALSGAAQQAGVQNRMFGIFHDAGYKGLYGGLGGEDIKARKGIPSKENLMDRMNATELAANQFRMTQTRDKLAREGVRDQQQAIRAHQEVGKEVRDAIQRIGGTPPEHIPAAEHIKEVERRIKTSTPRLELDEKYAGGLLGEAADKSKRDE